MKKPWVYVQLKIFKTKKKNKLQLEQYMQLKNDCGPSVFKERVSAGLTSGNWHLYFLKLKQSNSVTLDRMFSK